MAQNNKALDQVRWLPARNMDPVNTIPAFGVVGIKGSNPNGDLLVSSPSVSDSVAINGPNPIAPMSSGRVSQDYPLFALYDPAGGAPAVGGSYGQQVGSYLLSSSANGFISLSTDVNSTGRVLIKPVGGSGALSYVQNNVSGGMHYTSAVNSYHTISSGIPIALPYGTYLKRSFLQQLTSPDFNYTPVCSDPLNPDTAVLANSRGQPRLTPDLVTVSVNISWMALGGTQYVPFPPGTTGKLMAKLYALSASAPDPNVAPNILVASSLVTVEDYEGMYCLPCTNLTLTFDNVAAPQTAVSFAVALAQTTGNDAFARVLDFSIRRAPDMLIAG